MLHVLLDINCWRTDLGRCWVCQYIYNALLWTTPWRILHCSSLHHKALVSFDFLLFCQYHFELDFRELPACKSGSGDAWQQIRLWGCQEQPYGQKGQWAEELSFKSVQGFPVRGILSACYLMPMTCVNVSYFNFLPLITVQFIICYIWTDFFKINFNLIYLNSWNILVLNCVLTINSDCDVLYVNLTFY